MAEELAGSRPRAPPTGINGLKTRGLRERDRERPNAGLPTPRQMGPAAYNETILIQVNPPMNPGQVAQPLRVIFMNRGDQCGSIQFRGGNDRRGQST